MSKKNFEKNIFFEKGAQSEVVFRLLIDSIIGLAILMIILASLSYFQDQSIQQDKETLIGLITSAVNSPDGKLFVSKELSFKEGYVISSINTQTWTGLSMNCFNFEASSPSIELGSGSTDNGSTFVTASFERFLSAKVYAKCGTTEYTCNPRTEPTSPSDCCVNCIISFGKKIPESE